jgi:LysM repeat protein
MKNTNPFIPQGSTLEQNKRRSRLKLAVFCVLAVGVCGLTAMLIQGCKREQTETPPPIDTNTAPEIDTNVPTVDTNVPPPTMPSNTPPPVVVAPAPVTPVAPETAGTEYVIKKGDTLAKIAKANGVSLKALEAANPNVQPTKLKIGQKLVLPAGGAAATPETATASTDTGGGEIYVVKSGDTLTKIARGHGTTVKAIEAENNLTTTKIKVGQKLKMPAAASAAAPAAPAAPAPAPAPGAPEQPQPQPAAPASQGTSTQ